MSMTATQTILGTPVPLAQTQTQTVQPSPASEREVFFDAPILIIRTSQANIEQAEAEKDVTALSPETRAVAHQTVDPAPVSAAQPTDEATVGATNMDRQPTVAVGRSRSLLKKRRSLKEKKEPATVASPTQTQLHPEPAAPTEKPATQNGALPMPATTTAITHKPEPTTTEKSASQAGALAMPATAAAIAARTTAGTGAGNGMHVGDGDDDDDQPLSRDYGHGTTARSHSPARSHRSKRASILAAAAPSRSRAASRAASTKSRPVSRASTRGDTVYDTASGEDTSDSEAGSDEDEVASYLSPVAHNRSRTVGSTTKSARRTSAPPSHRSLDTRSHRSEDRGRRGDGREDGDRHRRAQSVSARSTAARSIISGGTFAAGAGTIGPGAVLQPEESVPFTERGLAAVPGLSQKQVKRIGKEELREGKRLSKVLKTEGEVERKAVEVAIKELAELQAMQKKAIKDESRAHTSHSKALKAAHDAELIFLEAQRKLQVAQADLRAKADALEAGRTHAQETTERVQEKNREVEMLRAQKGADSREREAKMRRLVGKA